MQSEDAEMLQRPKSGVHDSTDDANNKEHPKRPSNENQGKSFIGATHDVSSKVWVKYNNTGNDCKAYFYELLLTFQIVC